LLSVASFAETLKLVGLGRSNKAKEELLRASGLAEHLGKRARKGRKAAGFVKLMRVACE
jgi:topoisomerase-4 subunit A